MDNTRPKFLTLQEAAQLLRVSLKTVQRWRLLRQIRVHKAGRRVLVIESQLLEDLGIDPSAPGPELASGAGLRLNGSARGRS